MNAYFLYLHGTNIQFTLEWKKRDLYVGVWQVSKTASYNY